MQNGLSIIVNLALSGNWKTIKQSVIEFEMSSNVKDESCSPIKIQGETMMICDNINRIRRATSNGRYFKRKQKMRNSVLFGEDIKMLRKQCGKEK